MNPKLNQVNYVIKDYTTEDFSNIHNTEYKPTEFNMYLIAREVAKNYYDQDPCDPNDFIATIGIKDNSGKTHLFEFTAWVDVVFSGREIKG